MISWRVGGVVVVTSVVVVNRLLHGIVGDVRACSFALCLHIPAQHVPYVINRKICG